MLSPRIAPRGRALSTARPAGRRAVCFHVAIPRRDDRCEATDEARTPPMRRRIAIGDRSSGGAPPPRVVAAFSNPTSPSSPSPPSALVDALLASVAGASADRGSSMSPSERAAADALFDDLVRVAEAERRGGGERSAKNAAASTSSSSSSSSSSSRSSSSPLDSPLLLGDFDVAYVSTGGKQKGQPAGGRFRSGLGRALFSTTAVCQSIFYDDDDDDENVKEEEEKQLLVTNKVAFRLAGLLEGSVGLRGKVTAAFPSSDWKRAEMAKGEGEGEGERAEEERENGGGEEEEIDDAVRVDFDPAVLSLLPRSKLFRLSLRIGRPSWVALATPYVDERVRLGVGSLGSKFLFVRGGEAERQDMRRVGVMTTEQEGGGGATGPGARVALFALAAGLLCASAALLGVAWRSGAACLAVLGSSPAAAAAAAAAAPAPQGIAAASAAAVSSVLLPAARAAAALGATFLCCRVSLGALRLATGRGAASSAASMERERVGPGGRGDKGGVSAPSD